jgi:NAD(P)-dependent dehydrogenase (short-subunit alcohol dehydrogenase family)
MDTIPLASYGAGKSALIGLTRHFAAHGSEWASV